MIQEIEPKRFDNSYRRPKPSESDYLLCYDNNKLLVKKQEQGYSLPMGSMLPHELWQDADYLFSMDDDNFYLLKNPVELPPPECFEYIAVQQMREHDPRWMAFAAVTGWQLSRWKNSNRFCSRCGATMAPSETERALVCPACRFVVYPKISPAVIVAVRSDDRLLMINATNAPPERFHLIAGFVEIGETLEQAVAREVMEEAGVRVKNIRYYKNQPWSISDTLMIGFTADLDGDDALDPHDEEISVARWFIREEVPMNASSASIGSEMTGKFRDGTL